VIDTWAKPYQNLPHPGGNNGWREYISD
jgi:hypothetical protein